MPEKKGNIPIQMFIDGDWIGSGDSSQFDVVNPATEAILYSIPVATQEDLDRALAAVERSWLEWSQVDAWTRSDKLRRVAQILRERQEEIALAVTEEQGKPLGESRGELKATADQFDWYADEARRIYGRWVDGHSNEHRLLVKRQPIGPVAAFSPGNFPALLPSRKIAPAIAAGCAIIIKPAENAPRATFAMAEACQEAGIPAGVVNVVTGEPGFISEYLIKSDVIRKVTLTGSVPIGRLLYKYAAEEIKSVSMELGGHSPVLVFEDANVEEAARMCARGKFRNNGQVCISASRFIVQESVAEKFTEYFVDETRRIKMGEGSDPETEIGPLENARRLEAAHNLVQDAVQKGAKVAHGGQRSVRFPKGFFWEPTVITHVTEDMAIMTEEPFSPVAPITTFKDMADGLAKANSTPYGLAGYVFTNNTSTAFLASEKLDVGMVGVNNLVIATAEIPFGGIKKSGFGREGGSEGIEGYTVTKYINIKL